MRDIDQMIRDTLPTADVEPFERFGGEQGIQEMVIDSFRGKTRWMVTLVFVTITAFVVLAVLAAIQFFQVETVEEMIIRASAFIFCLIAIGMMKNLVFGWN